MSTTLFRLPVPMETLWYDLRHGARSLARTPALTGAAALTIAVGIAATTVVFTLVNAVLLRPLPVHDPDRLVTVEELRAGAGEEPVQESSFSYERFLEYREAAGGVLAGVAAQDFAQLSLRTPGEPRMLAAVVASSNYFEVLGIRPLRGRFFTAGGDRPEDAEPVAVLSHRLWREQFGEDPGVVGSTVHLNGQPYTVAGVAPAGFGGTFVGMAADVWVPIAAYRQYHPAVDDRREIWAEQFWLGLFGRLAPGVAPERAEAALQAAARGFEPEPASYPAGAATPLEVRGVRLRPLTGLPGWMQGAVVGFLSMLLATAVLVLLIASANVAGMLLARAARRRREVAVRLAMGAGQGRILRQLLTESVLLFLVGGAGGVVLAVWLTELVPSLLPPMPAGMRLVVDLSPDPRVLLFALGLMLATGVLTGLAPALEGVRTDLIPSLKETAPSAGGRRGRLRGAFVVAQLALSVLLLVTAGLFTRALQRGLATELGFEPEGMVVASVNLSAHGYDDPRGRALLRQLLERIEALPGVERASLAQFPQLSGNVGWAEIALPEQPPAADSDRRHAHYSLVDAGYFETVRTPILAGRSFGAADRDGVARSVIVNRALAARLWPGQSPLGRRLRVNGTTREVVGMAADAKYESIGEEPEPYFFIPFGPDYVSAVTLHVRARGEPEAVLASVRRELRALDPDIALQQAMPFPVRIRMLLFPQRFAATLIGVFGLVGLALAVTGVYGVLSFQVAQRTREIGIRVALGAHAGAVRGLVVRQGVLLAGLGIAIGLLGAAAVGRALSGLLYGLPALDPPTYGAVAAVLLLAAVLASYLPARRATRVDPMVALRVE